MRLLLRVCAAAVLWVLCATACYTERLLGVSAAPTDSTGTTGTSDDPTDPTDPTEPTDLTDTPSETQATDTPSETQATDTPSETQATDSSTEDTETVSACPDLPERAEPTAPTTSCALMDWNLSFDGFYLLSWFGTTADGAAYGTPTSCAALRDHYATWGCVYDNQSDSCLAADPTIPWVLGHVDHDFDAVMAAVDAYAPSDVPYPEFFYASSGQRFGCGSLLRVSNLESGRCVVVYVEDSGPGSTYEGPGYGNRRMLDASPAVYRFLEVANTGWASSDLILIEWGEPGDEPGHACEPCMGTAASADSENRRSPYDPNHMFEGLDCR